jgi:hypothetical protein
VQTDPAGNAEGCSVFAEAMGEAWKGGVGIAISEAMIAANNTVAILSFIRPASCTSWKCAELVTRWIKLATELDC